jgi:anti-sigma-K factor RskA
MSEADDIDMLAAEYALGTLSADERTAVAQRAQTDASLAAAIDAWELRLAPLAETIPERAVPAGLWEKIEKRIDASTRTQLVANADVVRMARSLARWRTAAIGAFAIAASLMLFVGVREFFPPSGDKTLVAILQKDAQSPAFLVSVDLDKRQLTIRAVAAKPEPGKSYELWLVHDDLKTPHSLGLIGDKPVTVGPSLTSYSPNVIEHSTLAVSLEPPGGSPTGAPTGPVLWSGKLLQATN